MVLRTRTSALGSNAEVDRGAVVASRQPTVLLALQGGLGNQLFQWAFARRLDADGVRVVVDVVRCRGDRPLAIGPILAPWPQLPRPVGAGLVLAERARLLRRRPFPRMIQEQGLGFDPAVLRAARQGGRLVGYFQSPSYFAPVADAVKAEGTSFLHSLLTPRGRELAERLADDPNSVAVHVRRGDYVSDPATAAHHGALDIDHYSRALSSIGHEGPRLWFSDDPAWVRDRLMGPQDSLCGSDLTVAPGGEIALMAACATRVIANSSFSWWGGYLGRQRGEGGRVVAPSRWLRGSSAPNGLLPEDWAVVA